MTSERGEKRDILKDGIAEKSNGVKFPEILKDGNMGRRNSGKFLEILKDGMMKNHPKS